MSFVYYQPNPSADLDNDEGDCSIRCVAKLLNCSWKEAFRKKIEVAEYINMTYDLTPCEWVFYRHYGFQKAEIENPEKTKITVKKFAETHTIGKYALECANPKLNYPDHIIPLVDGNWYDIEDTCNFIVYHYWKKSEE